MAKTNRRAQGEGSIFQLADGRWAADIDLGWENGKRKRKRVQAKTQAEVMEKAKVIRQAVETGLTLPPARLTVEKFLAEWLEHIRQSRAWGTYSKRERDIRIRINPALGKTLLTKLSVPQVRKLLADLAEKGEARNTILSCRSTLAAALHDAMRQGFLARNVASLAEMPKGGAAQKARRFLNPEEAARLLDLIQGEPYEAALAIMLSLGLRRGEVLGLRWPDIDFDRQEIHISGNLQCVQGEWKIKELKTGTQRRPLPLLPNLEPILKAHRARQALAQRIAGEEWQALDLVFTRPDGRAVHPNSFRKHFVRLTRAAGLSGVTPHGLRHSCATILLAQGVEMKVIQTILGHSRMAVTSDLYAHILPGATSAALRGMDTLLNRTRRQSL